MTCIVRRTCRELSGRESRDRSEIPPRPVERWGDKAALVLLGPPGSGKTTIFAHEAERQSGLYVTARDFLTFDARPEWRDTTLFIDGLDETRAGTADGRTPLDSIRAKLDRMGRPRFRLSCREADWLGANDSDRLKAVSPDGAVTVLRLEPLSEDGVRQILLANLETDDPDDFIASAQGRGLRKLLANPQSLEMLAVAVGSDGVWPDTRMQAFAMACRALLAEHNEDHRIARPVSAGVSDLMNAAGKLCAIQLLTGAAGYSRSGDDSDPAFPGLDRVPGEDRALLRRCLQSKLFEIPTQRRAVPVHRQIAEFLAARYLADLVDDGLPVGRILALMTGHDGGVVSELRGLSAWLAAHSKSGREEVIARDPLGTVLYGDASAFPPAEKRSLLEGLHREASANPRFIATLQLDSRLGDLVSSDMEKHFREILTAPSRGDSWQSFIVILVEALRYGERLPGLAGPLMTLLRDDAWWPRIRIRAIEPFLRHQGNDADASAQLKSLTADVHAGKVPDPDDAMLGCLLSTLYPSAIPETEIMQYLRLPRRPNFCPEYEYFWTGHLPRKSTTGQLAVLLDELAERYLPLLSEDRKHGLPAPFLRRLPSNLLARFLWLSGDEVDLTRLFHWLGSAACAGDWTHDPVDGREGSRDIRKWLEKRPCAWKTLLAMGLKGCIDKPQCEEPFGFAGCMHKEEHGRLFGVSRPSDFGLWCLDQAIVVEDANAAGWLLGEAAACLHHGHFNKGLSREVVSRRLAEDARVRDAFDKTMAELEAPASDRSVSDHHGHTRSGIERPNWHDHVKPHEGKLRENMASPALLYELAKVYFGGYFNVRGNSPGERLNTVLAGDAGLVEAVLSGFAGPSNGRTCPRTGRSYASEPRIERTTLRFPSWRVWKKSPGQRRPARWISRKGSGSWPWRFFTPCLCGLPSDILQTVRRAGSVGCCPTVPASLPTCWRDPLSPSCATARNRRPASMIWPFHRTTHASLGWPPYRFSNGFPCAAHLVSYRA